MREEVGPAGELVQQLAEVEGKSEGWVTQRLRFGRFLGFLTSGEDRQIPPRNLTERRFRGYWEQTAKGDNERQRFIAVQQALAEKAVVREQRGYGQARDEQRGFARLHAGAC